MIQRVSGFIFRIVRDAGASSVVLPRLGRLSFVLWPCRLSHYFIKKAPTGAFPHALYRAGMCFLECFRRHLKQNIQ